MTRIYNPLDQKLYTTTYLRKNKLGQKTNLESLTAWLIKIYKFKKNIGQSVDDPDTDWRVDGPEIAFISLEALFCLGLFISNYKRKNFSFQDIEKGFPQLIKDFVEKNPTFFNDTRFEEINEVDSSFVNRKVNLDSQKK